jgi:RHH-type transcriptional regulator, proline utilization regulon repressor / proline dehydrogenase / delta 1-pyrroline-5-carboxylate dehydrogenase
MAELETSPEEHWDQLDARKYADEHRAIVELLDAFPYPADWRGAVSGEAAALVSRARRQAGGGSLLDGFLREFSLASEEGIAIMCLAEALLRTPDAQTRDALIAGRIADADWQRHFGQSDSLFVNSASVALYLSGQIAGGGSAQEGFRRDIMDIAHRLGMPVMRKAVETAVQLMGRQFVVAPTIGEAVRSARNEGMLASFDMLGEGARTAADADRYYGLYEQAIAAVGAAKPLESGRQSMSIKLSALSARYEAVKEDAVWRELYPRLLGLVRVAAERGVDMSIDAEEADRLILSLKLFERLALEPEISGWDGLGIVVQAYQKRATGVIEALSRLAAGRGTPVRVRLVKGAYWDSEIKRCQVAGMEGYSVFTTKEATDLSYLVCAHRLLEASPLLFAQFASHNAHTVTAVAKMAGEKGVEIEFQRLFGMGEALYEALGTDPGRTPVRVYAPVGEYSELLPYLVRRLLENGANNSFVHAFLDSDVPAEEVTSDPVAKAAAHPWPHPRIPLPRDLYGPDRRNSLGRDYSMRAQREQASAALSHVREAGLEAGPLVDGKMQGGPGSEVLAPCDPALVLGRVREAGPEDIEAAIAAALKTQPQWDSAGGEPRARVLRAMADALEAEMDRLVALLALEAGKTLNDGVAEVREAADFCRYYAMLAELQFAGPESLAGPVGETNRLSLHGRGLFACISPWNFPLAIFTGQVAAALAAGNGVLAKPAEQTPLIAAEAVRLFQGAGLPPGVLALLPGGGATVGAALVEHPQIGGVAFTGGTDTGHAINRALAARPGPIVPLIAETGGLNAMFADTTALREQLTDDVILSAFGSAGQRCSALRLLYLPSSRAGELLEALAGALELRVIGDPGDPATDIGPVIDREAMAQLENHRQRLRCEARILHEADPGAVPQGASYFGPVIAEIPEPDFLEREVFGPILHVYRYGPDELPEVMRRLAARGFALTLGIHSRVAAFAEQVIGAVPAGNVYINRPMTGAVVGVQPFGGYGLSGTGPKAGGPHSLLRHAVERTVTDNIAAQGGDPALLNL